MSDQNSFTIKRLYNKTIMTERTALFEIQLGIATQQT